MKARGNATRWLGRGARRLALSPAAAMMWKVIAGGTEPGRAHGLLMAWPGWEYLSHHIWPTSEIPGAPYGVLSVRLGPYRGEPLVLPDGTVIDTGTPVGELHCNNKAVLRVVSGRLNPFAACREDLHAITSWIKRDQLGRQIQAFYGVTILSRGAVRLGFTIRAIPVTMRRRFERMFMTGLLLLYTPEGLERLSRGTTVSNYPQEIWISRRTLLRRYGDREARPLTPSRATRNFTLDGDSPRTDAARADQLHDGPGYN
ncbi:MAG: YkoP family protein [Candidatus Binataceae bacterium]